MGSDIESGARKRRILRSLRPVWTLAVVVGLLGALLVGSARPAHAGLSGQQIIVTGSAQYSVQVCNTNTIQIVCKRVNTPGYATPINGWWWSGFVSIRGWTGYNETGRYLGQVWCWVPPVNPGSDWWTCNTGW
jgi:hypothetical protein